MVRIYTTQWQARSMGYGAWGQRRNRVCGEPADGFGERGGFGRTLTGGANHGGWRVCVVRRLRRAGVGGRGGSGGDAGEFVERVGDLRGELGKAGEEGLGGDLLRERIPAESQFDQQQGTEDVGLVAGGNVCEEGLDGDRFPGLPAGGQAIFERPQLETGKGGGVAVWRGHGGSTRKTDCRPERGVQFDREEERWHQQAALQLVPRQLGEARGRRCAAARPMSGLKGLHGAGEQRTSGP